MLTDEDVQETKQIFSEVKCKMLIPASMLLQEEVSNSKLTIDITVVMPRFEVEEKDN